MINSEKLPSQQRGGDDRCLAACPDAVLDLDRSADAPICGMPGPCNSSHLLFFISLYMVKLFLLFANNVFERPENALSTPPAKHVAHALTGSGAITGSYRRGSCFSCRCFSSLEGEPSYSPLSRPSGAESWLWLAELMLSWRRRRSECIFPAPSVCASTRSASLLLMDMNIYPVRGEISTAEASQLPAASADTSR